MLALLALAVLSPSPHDVGAPTATPDAIRPRVALFGIDEVGITTEEPFSILPLEAFCNGAIAATNQEMLGAVKSGAFDEEP